MTDEYSIRLNGSTLSCRDHSPVDGIHLARGYMQYYRGEPGNILNNTHLSLMLNGALFLDRDLCSIQWINEHCGICKTDSVLLSARAWIRKVSLDNGSMKIDPQQDAFNSTGNFPGTGDYERAKLFDINATPITDYLNNGSEYSLAAQQIRSLIPQVYSTAMITVWQDRQQKKKALTLVMIQRER